MTIKCKSFGRLILSLSLTAGIARIAPAVFADTPVEPQPVQLADAQQLKTKALEALKAGKFDLTNAYLSQAAAISQDPVLVKMATWSKQFETQRQTFVGERHKEYEKAVADVHLLLEKKKEIVAMELAARAYLLADDKDAFRKEPWAAALLTDAKRLAEEYEKSEQWLRSLRLYSELSQIEPDNAEWKERLKISTRRIRLLALYVPEQLKKIQEGDNKEREEVDAILHPATQPAIAKATPDAEENLNKTDWHDALRDVRLDMLRDAVFNARVNYWCEVSFDKMMKGGLESLRVVATTPGLEKEFKGLADNAKRAQFLGILSASAAKIQKVAPKDEQDSIVDLLDNLRDANRKSIDLPEEVLVYEFADGAFAALDPFSQVMWPQDWEEFKKSTTGEFSGVGIQIQSDDAGNLKVVSPLEDSPAFAAKIRPDSIITHIEGKSARWINTTQAVKLITGPPGTTVKLTIKDPKGKVQDYKLTRQIIKVASVKGWFHKPNGGWDYLIDPDNKIGYLRMKSFTRETAKELTASLKEMTAGGVRGVILDLRYNPGGLLNAATDVVDKFISKGVIVSTRPDRADSPNQSPPIMAKEQKDEVNLPLVVLVNQYSASASEIVSGALKDHHRAVIVGERTFGKGSVQMLYPLGGQSAVLKLTTSHYYLPNGKCIHREENSKEWGVEPDVVVEVTPDQMRAAIDALQEFDILREAPDPNEKPDANAHKNKDPLTVDAQLSAALLLMRMQLANNAQL